jgi:hypothetical protein
MPMASLRSSRTQCSLRSRKHAIPTSHREAMMSLGNLQDCAPIVPERSTWDPVGQIGSACCRRLSGAVAQRQVGAAVPRDNGFPRRSAESVEHPDMRDEKLLKTGNVLGGEPLQRERQRQSRRQRFHPLHIFPITVLLIFFVESRKLPSSERLDSGDEIVKWLGCPSGSEPRRHHDGTGAT